MSIGNGNINAIFTKTMVLGDANMPCLALNYSLKGQANESPKVRKSKATMTIDADGASGSKLELLVSIKRYDETGSALADETYTIAGAAAKVDWAGTAPDYTASALTLKDAIDLLNEIPGMQAFALHAPHSASLNSGFFIDLAETDIPIQPAKYLECLYRDVSDYVIDTDKNVAFMRVGLPEVRDAGSMRLVGLNAIVTGATGGKVRLYRDDIREFSNEYSATYATEQANKQMYVDETLTDTVLTEYVDKDILNAMTIQGPVILAISASDLTACTARLAVIQDNV